MTVTNIRQGDSLSANNTKALHKVLNTFSNRQATAASAVIENVHRIVAPPVDGKLSLEVKVLDSVFAAGEIMVFTVKAVRENGTVETLGTFTVNNSNAGTVPVVLDGSSGIDRSKKVGVGDTIVVERTYTAGGGPTPATTTIATVQVE